MSKEPRRTNNLNGQIEALEDRLVMSADPLTGALDGSAPPLDLHVETPDFWRDDSAGDGDELWREIEQTLASAHGTTGLNNVRNDYGFVGAGQTVAVLDSGIAYDHLNLGGGLGTNYRVVGGWDFTGENDGDPYDDPNTGGGTSASHGTHVAGIIGSDHATHEGVAPDVDLVGLRVFDDSGAGYFSWVENALQWVHDNRNAFENPITAVNLSLGVSSWNSSTIPSWANLEEEFAQLEADGIFIAVSAGNAFTSYNTPGLSYPAASPYVTPVMSADDSGSLSFYSQRLQNAIAAPGRSITSTVPDFKGDNDGNVDDFGSKSGTSMAAPYVAGASVLIREAMEFVGQTNITQDTILAHMKATADTISDAATGLNYDRLNLEAAIDALMPTDDYGSTSGTAYDLGTLNDAASMSLDGLIGTLADEDHFTFIAGTTGTVTFDTTNTTHSMDAMWSIDGGAWQSEAAHGGSCVIDVVAGQTYTIGLKSSDGIGYFDLGISAESSFAFTDWGAFDQGSVTGVNVDGEGWYRVEATQDGFMTVESSFNGAGGNVTLEIYADDGTTLLASGATRVDVAAAAGQEFFVHAVGSNDNVDFKMTNLVDLFASTVAVSGTSGNDAFAFTGGELSNQIDVNGVVYTFTVAEAGAYAFDGEAGVDTIEVAGGGAIALDIDNIDSVANFDSTAFALHSDLAFMDSTYTFEDWGGWGERWVLATNGGWHFITQAGDFYQWDGQTDLASSSMIAQLSTAYFDNLDLITGAVQTELNVAQQAASIDAGLGLSMYLEYYENSENFGEKWMVSSSGVWYFITPSGDLHRWAGSADLADNPLIASLGSEYFADPTLLHDAQLDGSGAHTTAQALDASLGLERPASFSEDWGGWNEKWLQGAGDQWYFITDAGGVYRWNGSVSLAGSELVGILDSTFHALPYMLYDAAVGGSGQSVGELEMNVGDGDLGTLSGLSLDTGSHVDVAAPLTQTDRPAEGANKQLVFDEAFSQAARTAAELSQGRETSYLAPEETTSAVGAVDAALDSLLVDPRVSADVG